MFGKKAVTVESLPDIKITKMPDDFYGGNNPTVKFKTVEQIVQSSAKADPVLSKVDKKMLDKQTAIGAGQKLHPVNLFTSWKFLLISAVVILIVGASIAGIYYWWQYKKTMPVVVEIPKPEIVVPITTPEVIIPETPVTTTEPVVSVVSPVNTEVKIDFPSTLLGDSIDTDKDNISDVAEEVFNTDSSNSDSDSDTYPDGHEVFYLYNPAGKEPMKLVDSGLINVFTNPSFLYKLYYPKSWAVGNVDITNRDILFSTITGENIEVKVLDMSPDETFNDWFARNAVGEQLSDYAPYESVFKESGFVRKDNLVYFFPKGNSVFVIVYHVTNSSVVNYRVVAQMMARSFQFGNATEIPARAVEENLSSTTTSGVGSGVPL